MLSGYELIVDDHGQKSFVDNDTGEVVPAVSVTLPVGTISYTPQSQAAYHRRNEDRINQIRSAGNELGYFVFAKSEDRRESLSPQDMARLIFIATFLKYDDDRLYLSERELLKKEDLPKIMRLSKRTFLRFWNSVVDKYIFVGETDELHISQEFYRGSLKNRQDIYHTNYQKIYIATLRELYYSTAISQHRYLGYVFLLLPFINHQLNMLCWNPQEADPNKVEPMSIDDFCNLVGYDRSQRSRLIEAFVKIKFVWYGRQQSFCRFVTDDPRSNHYTIFVNPHILYRGDDWRRVEVLCSFF